MGTRMGAGQLFRTYRVSGLTLEEFEGPAIGASAILGSCSRMKTSMINLYHCSTGTAAMPDHFKILRSLDALRTSHASLNHEPTKSLQ
jgi:hypothetical protein